MCFLFRLDLSLYVGAEIFFWNLEFCIQTRAWFRHHTFVGSTPVPSPPAVLAMERGVRWTIQFLDAESYRCGSVDTAYEN